MVFGVCISLRFQPSVFLVLGEDDDWGLVLYEVFNLKLSNQTLK